MGTIYFGSLEPREARCSTRVLPSAVCKKDGHEINMSKRMSNGPSNLGGRLKILAEEYDMTNERRKVRYMRFVSLVSVGSLAS